MRDISAK